MRCTQFYGLSKQAQAFLRGLGTHLAYTDHIRRVYADGRIETFQQERQENNYICEQSDRITGMFDDAILDNYRLPDGRLLEERTQVEHWSSGPMIYTALWDVSANQWVKETLWKAKELVADGVCISPDDPHFADEADFLREHHRRVEEERARWQADHAARQQENARFLAETEDPS